MSKVSDFDGSLCEVNILRQKTDDCKTLNEIIDIRVRQLTVVHQNRRSNGLSLIRTERRPTKNPIVK
jgi:hypothetical protein